MDETAVIPIQSASDDPGKHRSASPTHQKPHDRPPKLPAGRRFVASFSGAQQNPLNPSALQHGRR